MAVPIPAPSQIRLAPFSAGPATSPEPARGDVVPGFRWTGEVTPQKWMSFYTKVLARFAAANGLKLTLTVDMHPEEGVSKAKIEEMRVALRELGMNEDVDLGRGYMSADPRDWLTPIWTGEVAGRSGGLIPAGLLGSIRFDE